jgi:tungstate transport system substrate-binding protein
VRLIARIAAWPVGVVFALSCVASQQSQRPSNPEVILATTTSTYDTGLLDYLNPLFERATGYQVKTISVGSGQALALGERGEVDVLLVHSPEAERAWMAAGNGTRRLLVMHNDFVIVGPVADPASIRGRATVDALRRIASSGSTWISRGDTSGTHALENQLWGQLGISPRGSWYLSVGQGMGQTLNVTNERQAYTLADRGSWVARRESLQLAILVEGDPALRNIYHVIPVDPARSRRVNAAGGERYADWIVQREAQAAIGDFGRERYGQPLFFPAAGRSEASLREL